MAKIYRAGLIPYYIKDGTIHMYFMVPSNPEYGGSDPQIAKGKVETHEDSEAAAKREAKEELGFFYTNAKSVEYVGNFLGRTHVYVAEIKDKEMFGDPHFETGETVWMTPEEFEQQGRTLHKPVVKAVVRFIKKQHKLK